MGNSHRVDSKQSSRILIADETAGGRTLLREILCADGHAVREAEDCDQLFHFTETFDPHLVILDLHMKVIDAYAVAESLSQIKPCGRRPLIGLSPAATQTFPDRIRQAGFSAYLVKPISPCELRSCVSGLLASRKTD